MTNPRVLALWPGAIKLRRGGDLALINPIMRHGGF